MAAQGAASARELRAPSLWTKPRADPKFLGPPIDSDVMVTPAAVMRSQVTEGERFLARPEEDLMASVLHDSLLALHKAMRRGDPRVARLTHPEIIWMKTSKPGWLFNYETICVVLGIGAQRLYRAVIDACLSEDPGALELLVHHSGTFTSRARNGY